MRDQLSQKSWENMADMIPDNIRHIYLLLLKRYLVLFNFFGKIRDAFVKFPKYEIYFPILQSFAKLSKIHSCNDEDGLSS